MPNDKVKDNTQQQMTLDAQKLTRVRTNNSFVLKRQQHSAVAQKPIVNNGFVADIQTNKRKRFNFQWKKFLIKTSKRGWCFAITAVQFEKKDMQWRSER